MIVIAGKSASGKDTVVKELISKYGYSRIVTYTTRPPRNGEIDGVSYHFCTAEEFEKKKNEGFFAETNAFHSQFGLWNYGSAVEDYENDSDKKLVILTPSGVRAIRDTLDIKPFVFYIFANQQTIKERLRKRGDQADEAKRRMKKDNEDFKCFEMEADKIIYNNEGTAISEVARKIIEFTEK